MKSPTAYRTCIPALSALLALVIPAAGVAGTPCGELHYGIDWINTTAPVDDDDRLGFGDPGFSEAYFDPDQPTLIYIHGAQLKSYVYSTWDIDPIPDFSHYLAQGYNIGIFDYKAFSAESPAENGEAKIWGPQDSAVWGTYGEPMRWRTCSTWNDWTRFSEDGAPSTHVTGLFMEEYNELMYQHDLGGNADPEVEIVAHSLGTQLAANFTAEWIAFSDLLAIFWGIDVPLPTRVTMLDPSVTGGDLGIPETFADVYAAVAGRSEIELEMFKVLTPSGTEWRDAYREMSHHSYDYWIDNWDNEWTGHSELVDWYFTEHAPGNVGLCGGPYWMYWTVWYWENWWVPGQGIKSYDRDHDCYDICKIPNSGDPIPTDCYYY